MSRVGAGDLLIAPPNLPDPRFRNTVVYLWEHGDAGSAGVVINKPSNHNIRNLIETDICPEHIAERSLYWGGPVHNNVVFMLHSAEWQTERTDTIDDHIAVTSDMRMFNFLSLNQPHYWQVYYGHSGWGPGQLEGEISGSGPWSSSQSWLVWHKPDPEWIFDTPTEHMWDEAITQCAKQSIATWL